MAGPSFLDLPFAARLKIYSYSGLIRYCPIDLSGPRRSTVVLSSSYGDRCWLQETRYTRFEGSKAYKSPVNCTCPDLPVQLLLISRSVSSEALSILVSRNKFVLRAHTGPDLAILQNMNPTSIAAMTSLLLRLNCWPCPRGHNDGGKCAECVVCDTSKSQSDPALNAASEEGQDLLRRWKIICQHLSRTSPGQLSLTIVCDVINDHQSAKKVIEPLLTLPTLKRCTIRLSRETNHELRALAENTSFRVTGTLAPNSGFPFERLPREIRLQILSYTHLTAPGTYDKVYNTLRIVDGKWTGRSDCTTPTTCCWKCTDTFADCCCATSHGSYSASCVCRLLPLGLLSVSKQMYEDTLYTFFSNACFELHFDPDQSLSFLEHLPKGSLRLLRRLRFVFDETDLDEWNQRNYTQKWRRLVRFIKNSIDVPKLSILIDTRVGASDLCYWDRGEQIVYDVYCEITSALCMLTDLYNVEFAIGRFRELGPLLAKEVLGERYKENGPPLEWPSHLGQWGQIEVRRDRILPLTVEYPIDA